MNEVVRECVESAFNVDEKNMLLLFFVKFPIKITSEIVDMVRSNPAPYEPFLPFPYEIREGRCEHFDHAAGRDAVHTVGNR